MKDILGGLPKTSVLVVGDLMIDNYLWGEVERISPEAPVPVVRVVREEQRLGGAANVANNLAALGCRVEVCGLVGQDALAEKAREMLAGKGIGHGGLIEDPARPTIEKTRIIAQNQQMLRFDKELKVAPSTEPGPLLEYLRKRVGEHDGVIVSDYGKGLVSPPFMAGLAKICRDEGKKFVIDPKGADYGKYRGANCLTPNEHEAAQATRIEAGSDEQVLEAGRRLMAELELESLCITRGARGVLAISADSHRLLGARAREVFDVTGAGDTFISVFGALLFAGEPFFQCVTAANLAAGVAVGKLGTATVTASEILNATEKPPKFHSAGEIEALAATLHAQHRRIVFTNGCFDLLHVGHVRYLQSSKEAGDVLIVGLNSDASVRRLKGEGRPVIGEEDRAHLLGALASVDYVVIFDEDTPLELIRSIKPHVLTKGADYTVEGVVGHELMKQMGGEVVLIPLTENRSTTSLIEKIAATGEKE